MPKARNYISLAQLAPGIVSERAAKFMQSDQPLDLFSELAVARAALSLECERYGLQHEAAMEKLENKQEIKDPDVRGVLAAIQTVDRVVGRIREIQFMDAIPVEQIRDVFEAMRATLYTHLADQPEIIQQVEKSWEKLALTES